MFDESKLKSIEYLLCFYNKLVLTRYSAEPDKYSIKTDNVKSKLETRESYYYELEHNGQTDMYVDIRFGYRTLLDGDYALVVWQRDVMTLNDSHRKIWEAYKLINPQWAANDEIYNQWIESNIFAESYKQGPVESIVTSVKNINRITVNILGKPLYNNEQNHNIVFPVAENTHSYQDAHNKL